MRPYRCPSSLLRFAADWQAALDAHPEWTADFLDRVSAAGVIYGDRPLCVTPQPMVVDAAIVRSYRRALRHLHVAVRTAREMIVADGLDGRPDSLAVRIGVDPRAIALAAVEPGFDSAAVLARFDSFLVRSEDGQPTPAFVELNAEPPAGMAYDAALARLFLEHPLTAAVGRRLRPFDPARRAVVAILDTWRRRGGHGHRPVVAIVDWLDQPTAPEFHLFRRFFEEEGATLLVLSPDALQYEGGRLVGDGQAIDIVYRRLLVDDLLARPEPCSALLDAYRAGDVCVVNSFRSSLLHGKGLFALLHAPELHARLPAEVVATIHATVPWTGLLLDRPGTGAPARLRARIRGQRHRWAIKPLASHGGAGVVLGWEVDEATWRAAVDGATHHVVQRRVPTWTARFPDARADHALGERTVSLDPFVVRGELAGFLCRLTAGSLGNVRDGAGQVPVLLLDE
ncbi:MAG: hypothetical protein D6798_15500 [Deltaproteobacteria bacterium]|nr:MAG: hypothetical protein D6798_15500 [Deltaproteobacteria bacterium]